MHFRVSLAVAARVPQVFRLIRSIPPHTEPSHSSVTLSKSKSWEQGSCSGIGAMVCDNGGSSGEGRSG
jgi:hypothetical protein